MKITWHDVAMWVIAATGVLTGSLIFATVDSYDREARTVATIALCTGLSAIVGLIALSRAKR